jgi:hypothetical protein
MPSVTIVVSVISGWNTVQSSGWKERRKNMEVERVT